MTAQINTAKYADKGSQRWLQVAVNHPPELLDQPILQAARLEGSTIRWLSPLKGEKFVEYRDGAALTKLGIGDLKRPLEDFWPLRGPCWDGLARTNESEYFLVEAKAHIGEMVPGGSKASDCPRVTRQSVPRDGVRTRWRAAVASDRRAGNTLTAWGSETTTGQRFLNSTRRRAKKRVLLTNEDPEPLLRAGSDGVLQWR